MEEKSRIIDLIQNADISNMFWADDILDTVESKYAKGYLKAILGNLNQSLPTTCEDYRTEFMHACYHDIWNK